MDKRWKILKVLSTTAFCASLLFSGTVTTQAAPKQKETSNSIENVQGAYYFVDGVQYEIPAEELGNFVSGDSITNLPYDPYTSTTTDSNMEDSNRAPDINYAYACAAGYEFDASRYSSGFRLGKSGSRVINETNANLTEVSQLGSDVTLAAKVSGSGSWSWGPIEAEMGFDVSASKTWRTSESTSITISPGDWGWIDYGTVAETWKGYYYYLTSSCGQSNKSYLTVDGHKYKAKLAKTEKYPY